MTVSVQGRVEPSLPRTKLLSRVVIATLWLALVGCTADDPEKLLASAKQYLAKDEYKAAVIQLKNVLQVNPTALEARFLLGKTFLAQGDASSAEVELRKALEAQYPADAVVPELARAMVLQGKNKEALREFGDTQLGTPAAAAKLKTTLAMAHAALGEMARAQASVDAALVAVPGDPEAALMQARLMAARSEADAALKTVEALLAHTPNNYDALKFKGDLLLYAKNQPDAAFDAYSKAVEMQPGSVPAYSGVLTILLSRDKLDEAAASLAQLKKIAPNNIEAWFFDAQLAYQKKDYKKAKESIQQVLKAAPNNPRFLQLAGAIEFQMNSLVQAEYFLGKALQAQPRLLFARRMLIATHLRAGHPARAVAALPTDIDKETNDADMLTLAGQAYLQAGDAKKSQIFLARAAQLDPASVGKRTTLALARLRSGETDAAMGQLREIAKSDSGTSADLELIRAYLQRREFDQALAAIERFEQKQPGNAASSYLRGLTYLGLNDTAAAQRNFEKALGIDPAFYPAAASLAALDLREKKPDVAKSRFENILKQDPKNLQAMLTLADLKARTGAKPEEVAQLLQKAIDAHPTAAAPRRALIDYYLITKNEKLALNTAQTALSTIPDDPQLLDALGRAQQAAGETNQALGTFGRLASTQPDSPQAQMRLAGMYLLDKKPEAAEQAWRQALKIDPKYLDAQRALIIHYLQAKKYQDALDIARTVKQQRPNEPAGWLLEGDIGVVRKNWTEAADAYRAGLKKFPLNILAIKLHAALQADDKRAEAANVAKTWLASHPKDLAFQSYLGNSALLRKDYASAESIYRAALQSQPQDPVLLNNLAWAALQQNEPGALEFAQKANELAPDRAELIDTLALALSQKGEHAKAIEMQKKAVGLQPDNPFLKLNLAKIYVNAGDKSNARIELERLAALGAKFPLQQEVAKLTASL